MPLASSASSCRWSLTLTILPACKVHRYLLSLSRPRKLHMNLWVLEDQVAIPAFGILFLEFVGEATMCEYGESIPILPVLSYFPWPSGTSPCDWNLCCTSLCSAALAIDPQFLPRPIARSSSTALARSCFPPFACRIEAETLIPLPLLLVSISAKFKV